MATPDVMAQYGLFKKYYNSAYDDCDLADDKISDLLLKKVLWK